jgi:hypothetical protein
VTYAPQDLLNAVRYLQSRGASASSLGIVGDAAHVSTGGYHVGRDDLARHRRLGYDYSVVESARDRHPTDAASAIDFTGASWWRPLTLWLVDQAGAGAPGTEDIREIIYTPDGRSVHRWDRLGRRGTGDSSHLYHTHVSFFRDSEGRRSSFLDLLRSYFEGITIQAPRSDDDMPVFQTGQLPIGFAITADGHTDDSRTVVLLAPAGRQAGLQWGDMYLSLGCDFGTARVRVAIHDGVNWGGQDYDIASTDGRLSLPFSAASGSGCKISLARVQTSDTDTADTIPVAWMLEIGPR